MNPKSKRYLIEQLVLSTGLEESKVEAIITFYWRTIRDFLQKPTHTSIFLNKLGTFSLLPNAVDDYIIDKSVYINRIDKKIAENEALSDGQSSYYDRCVSDLIWLEERKKDLKQEKLLVKSKKQIRNEYIKSKKEDEVCMEEQKPNTTGVLELAMQRWFDSEDSSGEEADMQEQ